MRDRSNECKTPPCANCGKERGGMMFAPFWGHSFSCCSEKCGREFARLHEQKARTPEGRKWLAEKWEWLESQCNYLLTGKPFHGYPEKLASDEAEERARIAEQREAELVECLKWYERYAKDVDRRGDLGHSARNAIANDSGKRARAILAKHKETK